MARQKKLSPERKAFIDSLIEHYQPEDAQDVQEMLKEKSDNFFKLSLFPTNNKILKK